MTPSVIIGAVIMLIFALFSFFPQWIAPYSPKDMFEPWAPMSAAHWLGTNDMGYDILSELIYAASTTMLVGITAAFISLAVGVLVGIAAGYCQGWLGEVINGFINIFLLIPMLPMTIILAAYLGAGVQNVILSISLLGWCSTARAVRAKTKQVKCAPFIESLQTLGAPKWRIMLKHILPNVSDVIWAKYILSVGQCMLTEASVSFMGLGDTTHVTWGGMINFAFKRGGFSRGIFNWYLPPGICILLCVMAFYLLNRFFEHRADLVDRSVQSYMD